MKSVWQVAQISDSRIWAASVGMNREEELHQRLSPFVDLVGPEGPALAQRRCRVHRETGREARSLAEPLVLDLVAHRAGYAVDRQTSHGADRRRALEAAQRPLPSCRRTWPRNGPSACDRPSIRLRWRPGPRDEPGIPAGPRPASRDPGRRWPSSKASSRSRRKYPRPGARRCRCGRRCTDRPRGRAGAGARGPAPTPLRLKRGRPRSEQKDSVHALGPWSHHPSKSVPSNQSQRR